MQAVIPNTMKLIQYNENLGRKFPKEVIPYLLKAVQNADAKLRSDIENQLVKIGENGITTLVDSLETSSGITQAMIAMVLIRLGNVSIKPLRISCKNNWIADYIINEIEGTQRPLGEIFEFSARQEVLVG